MSANAARSSTGIEQRRHIASTPVAQIEQTAVNQSEGEYAQTKDTVIQVSLRMLSLRTVPD